MADAPISIEVAPDLSSFATTLERALRPVLDRVARQLQTVDRSTGGLSRTAAGLGKVLDKLGFDNAVKSASALDDAISGVIKNASKINIGDGGVGPLIAGLADAEDAVGRLAAATAGIGFDSVTGELVNAAGAADGLVDAVGRAASMAGDVTFDTGIASAANLTDALDAAAQAAGRVGADIDLSGATAQAAGLGDALDSAAAVGGRIGADIDLSSAISQAALLAEALDGAVQAAGRIGADFDLGGAIGQAGSLAEGLESAADAAARASGTSFAQMGAEQGGQGGAAAAAAFGSMFGSGISGMASKLGPLAAAVGGGMFLKSTVDAGRERLGTIEDSVTALTVTLGGAEQAAQMVDDVLGVVTGTPFNLDQFVDAARTLTTFGVEAGDVGGILTAVGEAAASSGKGMEAVTTLVDVFAQGNIKGKFTLRDIWRAASAGVPVLQILSNAYGETSENIMKMISDGSILAKDAIPLLTSGIMEGTDGIAGVTRAYAGSMEALRTTTSGAAGGLRAAQARLGAAILEPWHDTNILWKQGAADMMDGVGRVVRVFGEAFAGTGIGEKIAGGFKNAAASVNEFGKKAGAAVELFKTGELTESIAETLDVDMASPLVAGLARVRWAWDGLVPLIRDGDFTAELSRAFGWSDDSPVVESILRVRNTFVGLRDLLTQGRITDALRDAFGEIDPEDIPVVRVLLNIREKVVGGLDWIRDTWRGFWDNFTSGGDIVGDGSGIGGVIATMFANIVETIGPTIQILGTVFGSALDAGMTLFEALREPLEAIIPLFLDLWRSFSPAHFLIESLLPVAESLGDTLTGLAESLAPVIGTVVEVAAVLATTLGGALQALLPILADVLGTLVDGAGGVLASLVPVIATLAEALGDVLMDTLVALAPSIPALAEALVEVAGAFVLILTALTPAIPVLAQIVVWIAELIPPIAEVISWLLQFKPVAYAVVAALGAWLLPIGSIVSAIGGFIAVITPVVTAVGGFLATLGGIVAAINPVVLAVGAIIAGLALLYFHVQPVRDAIDNLIDVVAPLLAVLWKLATGVIGFVVEEFRQLWDIISQVAGIIGAVFTGNFDELGERLGRLAGTILKRLVGLPGRILAIFSEIPELLWEALAAAFRFVVENIGPALGWIVGALARLPVMAVQAWWNLQTLMWGTIARAFTWVATRIPGAIATVAGFFAELPGRIISAIGAGAGWLWDNVIRPAVNWVIRELPGLLGRVVGFFVELPFMVLEGYINAHVWFWEHIIAPAVNWVITELPGLLGQVVGFFVSIPGRIIDGIGDLGHFLWDNVFVPAGTFITETLPQWGANIIDWFANLPGLIWDAMGDLGGWLWGRLQDGFHAIVEGVPRIWQGIVDTIHDAIAGIYQFLIDLPGNIANLAVGVFNAFINFGQSIIEGIVAGVQAAAGWVGDFVTGIGNAIGGWINDNVIDRINSGLDRLGGAIGRILPWDFGSIRLPKIPIAEYAQGDIVTRPTLGVFGEDGPEVILPLSKPERLLELALKALAMTGHSLPQFADGAIIGTVAGMTTPDRSWNALEVVLRRLADRFAEVASGLTDPETGIEVSIAPDDDDETTSPGFPRPPDDGEGGAIGTALDTVAAQIENAGTAPTNVLAGLAGVLEANRLDLDTQMDAAHDELTKGIAGAGIDLGEAGAGLATNIDTAGGWATDALGYVGDSAAVTGDYVGSRIIETGSTVGGAAETAATTIGESAGVAAERIDAGGFDIGDSFNASALNIDTGGDNVLGSFDDLAFALDDRADAEREKAEKARRSDPDKVIAKAAEAYAKTQRGRTSRGAGGGGGGGSWAYGGVINTPTFGVFGEDGPEVILPLSKPNRIVELAMESLARTSAGRAAAARAGIPLFADGAIIGAGTGGVSARAAAFAPLDDVLRQLAARFADLADRIPDIAASAEPGVAPDPAWIDQLTDLADALDVGEGDAAVDLDPDMINGLNAIGDAITTAGVDTTTALGDVTETVGLRRVDLDGRLDDLSLIFGETALDAATASADAVVGWDTTTNTSLEAYRNATEMTAEAVKDIIPPAGAAAAAALESAGSEASSSVERAGRDAAGAVEGAGISAGGALDGAATGIDFGGDKVLGSFNDIAAAFDARAKNLTPDWITSGGDQRLYAIAKGKERGFPGWAYGGAMAMGGVVRQPTVALIGEDGPEVVLPLSKPERIATVAAEALGGVIPAFADGGFAGWDRFAERLRGDEVARLDEVLDAPPGPPAGSATGIASPPLSTVVDAAWSTPGGPEALDRVAMTRRTLDRILPLDILDAVGDPRAIIGRLATTPIGVDVLHAAVTRDDELAERIRAAGVLPEIATGAMFASLAATARANVAKSKGSKYPDTELGRFFEWVDTQATPEQKKTLKALAAKNKPTATKKAAAPKKSEAQRNLESEFKRLLGALSKVGLQGGDIINTPLGPRGADWVKHIKIGTAYADLGFRVMDKFARGGSTWIDPKTGKRAAIGPMPYDQPSVTGWMALEAMGDRHGPKRPGLDPNRPKPPEPTWVQPAPFVWALDGTQLMRIGPGQIAPADAEIIKRLHRNLNIPGFAAGDTFDRPVTGIYGEAGPEIRLPISGLPDIVARAGGRPLISALRSAGTVVNTPTVARFGEDAPEVILPLSRPRRVAALMAAALPDVPRFAGGGTIGSPGAVYPSSSAPGTPAAAGGPGGGRNLNVEMNPVIYAERPEDVVDAIAKAAEDEAFLKAVTFGG